MKEKFIALLTFTSSLKNFGIKFIRVAILVVFVWIGGLKYFHYEADGIVPVSYTHLTLPTKLEV